MRTLRVALTFVLLLVLAATAGRQTTPAQTRTTIRVATYNIHKGAPRRGPYHLERTIDVIARVDADLVGLQEVMQNYRWSDCEDQPARITEGLRRRTGRPWTPVFVKAWVGEDRYCEKQGQGDGAEAEGLAIFAAEPIESSASVRLPESRVGLEVRLASMPDVPIVVTHLAPNRVNERVRVTQIAALLPWARHRGPGLIIGDLNAEPAAGELEPLLAQYRDAWAEAAARGKTRGIASGSTRPNRMSRIDYVLYARESGLALESAQVIDTASLGLGEVSDHNPVVVTFRRAGKP